MEEEIKMCEDNKVEIITNYKDIKKEEEKKEIINIEGKKTVKVFFETLGCV